MMPKPVLLMISSMRGGGSERQTLLLLRHLDRTRVTPHLYLTEREGHLLAEVPDDVRVHAYRETDDAFVAESKGWPWHVPGSELRRQTAHLEALLRSESIHAVYDRTFHMTLVAAPAARRAGVSRVSTIVSPPDRALPHVEKRFVAAKKWRLARAYRDSAQVVAVSRQAARSAKDYYGIDDVRVIPNPVDTALLRSRASETPPHRDGAFTLVCVGRFTEEKGQRDLIDALALTESDAGFETVRVWLIGEGPLRESVRHEAESKLRRHRIDFLGASDNPAPAIAAADALVLPSHFEGMPNVVLEAMALGTPVVATRAGGTTELERDRPTIQWAEPSDPASLAEAIQAIMRDCEPAQRRAAEATEMIRAHHDVARTTRQIEDLLLGQ